MNTLGKRIAHFRKAAGLTQGQLAKACGWGSQSRVGNYESGTREPSFADLKIMADAMGVDFTELLKLTNEEVVEDFAEIAASVQSWGMPSSDHPEIRESALPARCKEPDRYSEEIAQKIRQELMTLIEKLNRENLEDLAGVAHKMLISQRTYDDR